jgi:transcriptional regulator with XRE-family HTH domain
VKSYTDEVVPGQIVAARREEQSLNQTELAQRLGYPYPVFISMMEGGKSRVPVEKAVDIAEALEMDPAWFVKRVWRGRYPKAYTAVFGAEPKPATSAPDQSHRAPERYRVRL